MHTPDIAWRIVLATLLTALVLATTGLLVVAVQVLLLIFAGLLFGVFLNALSRVLLRFTPLSYRWAYFVVVVLLIALAAGGVSYMGSQALKQVSQLTELLQSAGEQLTEQVQQSPWARRFLSDMSQKSNTLAQAGQLLPAITTGVQWLSWSITALAVVFFVGLYVAYEPELYQTGLVKLVPPARRARAAEVLRKLRAVMGRWILGRLISMGITGILTAIGLWLLGVPLPVTLGVIAALLTFIPNIGALLSTVPQALLALQMGTTTVLYVILLNVVLQGVEGYLITPMVQRYEVSLPPALTISMQLLMAVLVGVIGIIMAAPLTAAAMLLIQMLHIRDSLGDPNPGTLAETE